MAKGQVSVEILSYYIILFGVFLVTLILIVYNQRSIEEERTIMHAKNLLVSVKNEIDIAVNVGDGYSHSFFLPYLIQNGKNYSISVLPEYHTIFIEFDSRNISLPLLTDNITATIRKGQNIIKNKNGMITFE